MAKAPSLALGLLKATSQERLKLYGAQRPSSLDIDSTQHTTFLYITCMPLSGSPGPTRALRGDIPERGSLRNDEFWSHVMIYPVLTLLEYADKVRDHYPILRCRPEQRLSIHSTMPSSPVQHDQQL